MRESLILRHYLKAMGTGGCWCTIYNRLPKHTKMKSRHYNNSLACSCPDIYDILMGGACLRTDKCKNETNESGALK